MSTSGPTSAQRRPQGGRRPPKESAVGRWLGVLAVIGLVAFFMIRAPTDPPPLGEGGAGGEAPIGEPPPRPRCKAAEGTFRVGDGPDASEGAGDAGGAEPERFAPFSVEIGRGARTASGWVVGIKRDVKTDDGVGTFAEVVVLDDGASKGRVVRLGRTRGDLDAPLVVAARGGWVAAMLEPNASGLSTRLVRTDGEGLHWGAEIEQGRDESLAHDLAIGERVGVVTWDDVVGDGERAVVMVATVATESLEGGERAVAVSGDDVDAELPRLVRRPGGFWLAYVARSRSDDGEPRDPRATEGRFAAERIVPSWIELLPLDEDGNAQGEPRPVTARTGHVLAFDMGVGRDGGVVIALRDDDTPSGAQGGTVTAMFVGASGVGQEQPITSEEVGAGVPNLVGGFVTLPDGLGHVLAAPIAPDAELGGELRREDAFGIGPVLAADGDRLLVARPSGKAADFAVVTCSREP